MLSDTNKKGLSTLIHALYDFTMLGFQCSTPFGDDCKYDLVVDLNGKFVRIQCKHSRWSKDTAIKNVAFEISTCCQTTNTKKTTRHKYTDEQIDYFYTWFNGKGYLVSIKEAVGTSFRWRYEYPDKNQKQGIHIASNYELTEVLKTII